MEFHATNKIPSERWIKVYNKVGQRTRLDVKKNKLAEIRRREKFFVKLSIAKLSETEATDFAWYLLVRFDYLTTRANDNDTEGCCRWNYGHVKFRMHYHSSSRWRV